MVQTNCARDCSGYRPAPKAMKAYERKARPGAQIKSKQFRLRQGFGGQVAVAS